MYSKARRLFHNVSSTDEITPEWIASLPGRYRPPWWHPIRRRAWDYNQLAANGTTILDFLPARKRPKYVIAAGDSWADKEQHVEQREVSGDGA